MTKGLTEQSNNELTTGAPQFEEIIALIKETRSKVLRSTNRALIDLYWNIGRYIFEKLVKAEWGDGVVRQLASYIGKRYPELKGFSDKNLWRMKQFYETYQNSNEIISTLLRQISWSNNIIILSRTKSIEEKEFYLNLCKRDNLSVRELNRQIDSSLFERTLLSETKVSTVLREFAPKAKDVFRDSYILEFISGENEKPENSLRHAIIRKMKNFILELGKDFLFMGEEFKVQVGMSDYRIDLLFYHRELRCMVAFELKTGSFNPEYMGELNFYLEALDRDVRKPNENPSIGVLLCRDKDDAVVEYALSRSLSPTLVAEYSLCLPDK